MTKKSLFEQNTLPPGFSIRAVTMEDLVGVTDLIVAVDMDEQGETDVSLEETREYWTRPDFSLESDAWLVEAPADENGFRRVVGYEDIYNRSGNVVLDGDGYVHPEYRDLGIGTTLLRALEDRAREMMALAKPEARVVLRNGMDSKDQYGRKLQENEGYQPVRHFYRMQIDMELPPQDAELPAGLELRPFRIGVDDRPVFDALEEGFRDHWGFTPWNYELWRSRSIESEGFDPDLFLIAWDGDKIAGASLCKVRPGYGWVSQLAVRRPWRRAGLGMALLKLSFAAFYQRGYGKVGLGVDAASPTGATRLYERAGMRVVHEFVLYEKELRSGEAVIEDL